MPRRRALQVCKACHERKVRCDMDMTPGPCSNCKDRLSKCVLRERQLYRSVTRNLRNAETQSDEPSSDASDHSNGISHGDLSRIVSSIIAQPGARTSWIYVGDSGYGAVFHELGQSEGRKGRHVTINGTKDAVLSREDLEYLQLKGCFNLPAKSDDLFAAYFDYVHPLFPVLDGPSFLRDYANGGLNGTNLLLLWSMFSVSAGYVEAYANKEAKASFATRAKLLFHLSSESDKLVLIRSALMLSFWFDDAEDVKQSWYWSGIAFSIAQTLGLHHTSLSKETPNAAVGPWKIMWHCCLLRDAWLSYSMGRPLRLIDVARDGISRPRTECQFRHMKLQGNSVYSDMEADEFEKMWRGSMTAAFALRQCLSPTPRLPIRQSIRLGRQPEILQRGSSSLRLTLCYRHLQLCWDSARIALSQLGDGDKGAEAAAADGIIATVKAYHGDATISYVPLMVVPLVMPAMLVSISELRSADTQHRQLGEDRLACCLELLSAIEQTYPAASIVRKLFCAAYDNIR